MDHKKDTCLQYENWNKKAASPCWTSDENVRSEQLKFSPLCICPQMTVKTLKVLILGGFKYILVSREICKYGIQDRI